MVRTGATLSDAAAEWLRYCEHEHAVKQSTLTEYRHSADRIVRGLGDVALEDVTPEMLERWKGTLTGSNRRIATYLINLHGIFKRAMKVWGLPRNPVADVERPRSRASDDLDAFSPEEVWALVRAAGSPQDAALFLTAAFTGLRMGELLALQWRDVDFAGHVVRVRRSYNIHGGVTTPKSGKVRSVPLVDDVAQALARLGEREDFVGDDELVFPRTTSTASWTPAPVQVVADDRSAITALPAQVGQRRGDRVEWELGVWGCCRVGEQEYRGVGIEPVGVEPVGVRDESVRELGSTGPARRLVHRVRCVSAAVSLCACVAAPLSAARLRNQMKGFSEARSVSSFGTGRSSSRASARDVRSSPTGL